MTTVIRTTGKTQQRIVTLLSLAALVSAPSYTVAQDGGELEWTGNGHLYVLTSGAMNWNQAQAEAVSMNGHLVSINSAAEQAFIEENFLVGDFANRPLWIGLSDADREGTFVWNDVTPLAYTNWEDGEPNNYRGVEDNVCINWHFARGDGQQTFGQWNDSPLNGSSGFGGNTNGPYYGIIEIAPTRVVNFQVRTGHLREGGRPQLVESDNRMLHMASGIGRNISEAHLLDMIVFADTSRRDGTTIDIAIESRIDEPVGSATILLHNWTTDAFDVIDQYTIGDEEETVILEDIPAADYISGLGDVEVQIKYVVFAPFFSFQFEIFFDMVRVYVAE